MLCFGVALGWVLGTKDLAWLFNILSVSVLLRRTLIALGVIGGLLLVLTLFAVFQLSILQPPVVEPAQPQRLVIRRYRLPNIPPPMSAYASEQIGQARIYLAGVSPAALGSVRAAQAAKAVLLLPDIGTGAWLFEPYMPALAQAQPTFALSLRGSPDAARIQNATFADYLEDARAAFEFVKRRARVQKITLVGEGMGSLLALRLANERPNEISSLALLAPYVPRERSDLQNWLARTVGDWVYQGIYTDREAAREFWLKNFPSGFVQGDLASFWTERYARDRVPFEYKPVIEEIILGPLEWLESAYERLGKASFPVLQIHAKYDVSNPDAAQLRLREILQSELGSRYSYAMLLCGKLISLDWRWQRSSEVLLEFLKTGRLSHPVVEEELVLEPGLRR